MCAAAPITVQPAVAGLVRTVVPVARQETVRTG